MNNLEFRAWHKESKEMIQESYHGECFKWLREGQSLVITQYIDIKDKDGVKIFDGDILKWDSAEWGGEFNELVKWDYELLAARKNDWHEWCEVVGNKFQNPELLS